MIEPSCRDLLYASRRDSDDMFCYSYGIEFVEFMSGVKPQPTNLLLLKHRFDAARWNAHTGLEYVTAREIGRLIEDDIYGYGDFCWVDFEREEDLDVLTRPQIAELLLFGHLAEPLNGLPLSRFAYYGHDDGWFNKTYFSRIEDYEELLSGVVLSKLSFFTGKERNDLPDALKKSLMDLTTYGLFIDFRRIKAEGSEIRVPIATVGHHIEMDLVYELRDTITDVGVWLVYSEGKWRLAEDQK